MNRVLSSRSIWLSLAYVSVVGVAASYLQALRVVQAVDGRGAVGYFVAGLADPTLFAAVTNISDSLRRGQGWPKWSVLSVVVALVVTGGANVMAGTPHDVPEWMVRLWPPVAFLMALESLMSYQRRRSIVPDEPVHADAGPPDIHADVRWLLERHSQRQVAALTGAPRSRIAKLAAPPVPVTAALNGDGPHGD